MRTWRANVAVLGSCVVGALCCAAASAQQLRTQASVKIERPISSEVVRNVLANVSVTMTVMSHPGETLPAQGMVRNGGQNLALSSSLNLDVDGSLVLGEGVSVLIGVIAEETELECVAASCDGVMVVLAQYN